MSTSPVSGNYQIVFDPPPEKVFQKFPQATDRHMRQAMAKSTMIVEGEVKPLTPVGVSSRLRNSIGSQISGFGGQLQGKVGSTLSKSEEYPLTMEFGRNRGSKMPPPKALERWVQLVLGIDSADTRGIAFVIARTIRTRGIKGRGFFKQGWRASEPRVKRAFASALHDLTREIASYGR